MYGVIMKCRLCNSEGRVVSSHIIPEFLYKALYDDKHRFLQIPLAKRQREQFKQKGLKERLLCEACEQQLSVPENYVNKLLHGGVPHNIAPSGENLRLSGLDYAKLKLFQMSILWRAGVSKLPQFEQVQLGPHEERLRGMLKSNDPGTASDYGCIMSLLFNSQELLAGLVVPPTHGRICNRIAYRFVFGGLVFLYVVARPPVPSILVPPFAQLDGTALLRKQQINEMSFLMKAFADLKLQGKLGPTI
jgi:hypothetical protein